ncbi:MULTISPECIES: ABC transporter ATP-binding protein [unclassified Blastococcus]
MSARTPLAASLAHRPAVDPGHPWAISTAGLTRSYPGGAGVHGVDLLVPRGSVYGIVGPNGAGKTTLLSIVTGLRRADAGSVTTAVPVERIAVCPDVPDLEPWLTAAEAVELARSLSAPHLPAARVHEALSHAGLGDAAYRRVGGFSRGMRQRVGLAAALVTDPEILVLDEPTSALDPAGRAGMLDLIAGMAGDRTVILSTHILADVERVADTIGVLRDGRLLYQGATADLLADHARPAWTVRLRDGADRAGAALEDQPWVTRVTSPARGVLRVDVTSAHSAEIGLVPALAACGARIVAIEPHTADLETAFLSLTTTRENP